MTPQLRFPEFTDEWRVKRLGDIAEFSKGSSISKNDIHENGKIEAIRYGELYTTYNEIIDEVKSKTSLSPNGLKFSKANDVIIPASGETAIDIATASCVLRDNIALSGDLNIIRTQNNGVFMAYLLNNKKKNDIARLAQGVSVIHLYSSNLKDLVLNLPSKPEQEKIADFLTAVDARIAVGEKKLELLETYKRGVMQKIFTRTVRFKDENGNPYPDWEEKKLGSFIRDFKQSSTIQDEYPVMTSSRKGIILQKDYYGDDNRITERSNVGYNVLPPKYLTYRSRSDDGRFRFNLNTTSTTGIVSYFYPVFDIKSGNVKFFEEYLNYNWRILYKYSVGTSQKVLSHTELKNIRFDIPVIEEQQKIAAFFTALDDKITAEKSKLTAAKQFKKALLQRMFA